MYRPLSHSHHGAHAQKGAIEPDVEVLAHLVYSEEEAVN
jgi:hypothetical protein